MRKKILVRSGMAPWDMFSAEKVISYNSIGSNVGNLIYAYSIFRNLSTENTELVPDYYEVNPLEADMINQTYDAYVFPLADSFREDFMPTMRRMTELIKKLKIPVYVIGVGLRAPYEPKLNEGFPFDEDVKEFVKAVLEKSPTIGLRGQITSDYLTRLGFREGIDHKVIGCPSMYAFGRDLHIKKSILTKDSLICTNASTISPNNLIDFIHKISLDYDHNIFIPQWMGELVLGYTGTPSFGNKKNNYPNQYDSYEYENGKVRFFLNAKSWIDYLKKADFSIGTRLHGNITATIAGTPSISIPIDARMRELSSYHNLTTVSKDSINNNTTLESLIEKADFHSPEKVQHRNFDNFIDFLNKNEIDHIYKNNPNDVAPLDKIMETVELVQPVKPFNICSKDEIIQRIHNTQQLVTEFKNENKVLKRTIVKKNAKISYQGRTLKRKAVRYSLKIADLFAK